jgi:hypothetical protein
VNVSRGRPLAISRCLPSPPANGRSSPGELPVAPPAVACNTASGPRDSPSPPTKRARLRPRPTPPAPRHRSQTRIRHTAPTHPDLGSPKPPTPPQAALTHTHKHRHTDTQRHRHSDAQTRTHTHTHQQLPTLANSYRSQSPHPAQRPQSGEGLAAPLPRRGTSAWEACKRAKAVGSSEKAGLRRLPAGVRTIAIPGGRGGRQSLCRFLVDVGRPDHLGVAVVGIRSGSGIPGPLKCQGYTSGRLLPPAVFPRPLPGSPRPRRLA